MDAKEAQHLKTCMDSLNAIVEENHILREQYQYPHPNSHAKLLANYSAEVTRRKSADEYIVTLEESRDIRDELIRTKIKKIEELTTLVNEKNKMITLSGWIGFLIGVVGATATTILLLK